MWYGEMLGSFIDQQLDSEREHFDCPLDTFLLILVLRKLLGESVDGVFYKTDWNYDSSDGCMSETTIFLYRDRPYYTGPVLQKVAYVVHDQASMASSWDEPDFPSTGSFECITMPASFGNPRFYATKATLQLLLQVAGAAGDYTVSFLESTHGDCRIVAQNEDGLLEIGRLRETRGKYGARNCAFALV